MSTRTLHATGPVAPAEAWERCLFPARWPEWLPQVTAVEFAAERLAPGLTGKIRAPLGISIPFAVDDVDEAGRRWSWRITVGPVRLALENWFEEAGERGTTTGMSVRGPGLLVSRYASAAQGALDDLVR